MTAANPSLTSVVMVTYNTGPVLMQAIEAVLAQTVPVELMLVDNGNPADITAKLQALAEKDSRIRLISGHGNVGFSRGCNMGASAARGACLLFLNPDSLIPRDAIAKLREEGGRLKRPYMLGARLVNEDGSDQRGCRRALLTPMTAFIEALHLGFLFPANRLNRHEEEVPDRVTPMEAISGAFVFLPREDFWGIGGFDEGYFLHVDDLDLCLRFRRAGGEIYFVPSVIVTHVGGTSKTTQAFVEKHKARGFTRYFHKNFGSQHSRLFLRLLDVAIWARAYARLACAALTRQMPLTKTVPMATDSAAHPRPYVSVVIPTYNHGKLIGPTIESVLAQTYDNFELIIVNDASPDSTIEDLKKFTDPRIVVISHEINQGSGPARNTGIKHARGEWVAFLDHDDQWMPDKLARQLGFMETVAKGCPASATDYMIFARSGRWVERRNSKLRDPNWLMLTGTGLSLSTLMAKRAVFEKIGMFDPQDPGTGNRTEDWDWFLRYRSQFPLAIVPLPLTRYNGSHRHKFETERKAIQYIWDKHGPGIRQRSRPRDYCAFKAAYIWKLARVDLDQKRYGDCLGKVVSIMLKRPFDAFKYARIVLGDVVPGPKNRKAIL
jgi:GT2 family glycosyltransferase